MNIDEMIAVLQAAKDGKKIEMKENGSWKDADLSWLNRLLEYRVAPKPREIWIPEDGMQRNHDYVAFNFSKDECLQRNIGPAIHFREVMEDEE